MNYRSTRGAPLPAAGGAKSRNHSAGFCDVLLGGLAPDGGLVMPEAYPQVDADDLERWRGLDYPALAFEVMSRYITDIPADELRTLLGRAYSAEVFGSEAITPVSTLDDGLYLLHCSNGPTLAFKDVAMQFLGHVFEWALKQRGASLNILGATSGDTGSAAEYAMRGREGVRVFMLSPAGRMSAFQRAQMFSLDEPNIYNLTVEGVFDDCQDLVKAVSEDLDFKREHKIGAVNSINWGRVVAQVVYYFKAWLTVTSGPNEQVSFAVPSGNFGNVLAGHVARQMGLPIKRLVVATNENDVLDEFFRTGAYRVRASAETHETSSPSMDISKASNFERFVFDFVGRDTGRVAALWRELAETGGFDLGGTLGNRSFAERIADFGFVSGRSTHGNRIETIRRVHKDFGVFVDTHTADGLFVAERYREPGVPMVCLETALPVKFAETIREALDIDPPMPAGFEDLLDAPQHFESLPRDVDALKHFIHEAIG